MKIVALMAVMTMLVASFAGCGKTSDTFKIGGIGPITGPASSYGISVKRGSATRWMKSMQLVVSMDINRIQI